MECTTVTEYRKQFGVVQPVAPAQIVQPVQPVSEVYIKLKERYPSWTPRKEFLAKLAKDLDVVCYLLDDIIPDCDTYGLNGEKIVRLAQCSSLADMAATWGQINPMYGCPLDTIKPSEKVEQVVGVLSNLSDAKGFEQGPFSQEMVGAVLAHWHWDGIEDTQAALMEATSWADFLVLWDRHCEGPIPVQEIKEAMSALEVSA